MESTHRHVKEDLRAVQSASDFGRKENLCIFQCGERGCLPNGWQVRVLTGNSLGFAESVSKKKGKKIIQWTAAAEEKRLVDDRGQRSE